MVGFCHGGNMPASNDDDDVDVDDAGCQPEVLSATRHAQHDEPGQTHARQPENHCIVIILIIFLPLN